MNKAVQTKLNVILSLIDLCDDEVKLRAKKFGVAMQC